MSLINCWLLYVSQDNGTNSCAAWGQNRRQMLSFRALRVPASLDSGLRPQPHFSEDRKGTALSPQILAS
jgi:hypothetical protein